MEVESEEPDEEEEEEEVEVQEEEEGGGRGSTVPRGMPHQLLRWAAVAGRQDGCTSDQWWYETLNPDQRMADNTCTDEVLDVLASASRTCYPSYLALTPGSFHPPSRQLHSNRHPHQVAFRQPRAGSQEPWAVHVGTPQYRLARVAIDDDLAPLCRCSTRGQAGAGSACMVERAGECGRGRGHERLREQADRGGWGLEKRSPGQYTFAPRSTASPV